MNVKTTLILFGLLCVVLGGFALFQILGIKTTEEREHSSRYLVASFHDKFKPVEAKDFTRVVVERTSKDGKAERFEFEKTGDDWKMVAPKAVRTDNSAVIQLVNQIMSAERVKYLDLERDLAKYGLEDPRVTVTLYRGDQETVVKFGDLGPEKDPTVYALASDDAKQPAAVKKSAVDKVFAGLDDFRDKRLFGSSFDVQGVRVAAAGKKPFEFEKVDRDWKFKEPKLGDAESRGVDDLVHDVTAIQVDKPADFVADGPFDEAALAKYGLSKDKASTITVRRKSPTEPTKTVEESLLIGVKDPSVVNRAQQIRAAAAVGEASLPLGMLSAGAALAVREKQDQDQGGFYAKLADDNTVVRIDAKHVKLFDKNVDDLRSKRLAHVDANKTDAIDLTSGGETLRFRRPELKVSTGTSTAPAPASWDLYTDTRAKVKSHLDTVQRLVDAFNQIELRDGKAFLDDTARQREWFGKDEKGNDVPIDFGLDKPQAEALIWQEGIKRDKDGKPEGEGEPKLKDDVKGKPNLRLAVGRKDEKRGVVYVRRQVDGGETSTLAVPDPWISASEAPPQFPGQPPRPPPLRETLSLTDKVTGGYFAFRDRVLPSFVQSNATKLAYQRGGVAYELDKEEKKDEKGATVSNWLLKKPVEGKGGAWSVEGLLGLLSRLSADKLITDRATERDLKEVFSLTEQPLFKAAVTVTDKDDKKKSGEYTYVLGKKTPADGKFVNHVYARIEVKPAEGSPPDANHFVFAVPWGVVQSLDAELRDATVFEEEKSAKPVEATLTWRKLDKDKKLTESKLQLAFKPEKEGSDKKVWTVQALTVNGKDEKANLSKLDQEKIEQLLGTAVQPKFGIVRINPLSTQRFVVHNGKPDATHGLDPAGKDAPPALVLEVKYDNQSTRSLTIGSRWEPKDTEAPSLHPRAFYYAAASSLPNTVFVLPEPEFKPLADGWEFFRATDKVAAER
jgi:hypothetical protein